MRHEIKKISRIVDELTTLLLREDTDEVDLKIKKDPNQTMIKIVDYNTRYSKEDVIELNECFNVQRQHELEEFYWQLVGETDNGYELNLIGAMVDEATVELLDGNLVIVLIRKK